MGKRFKVHLQWDPGEKVYVATVPDLGCSSLGDTREEALANAREAIEVTLQGLAATGQSVPQEGEITEIEVSL